MGDREKWNAIYAGKAAANNAQGAQAALVLRQHSDCLPPAGRALDLACGRGGNALLLAARGLDVEAWDIADTVVGQLRRQAAARGLALSVRCRDVTARPPTPDSFDVIVVSRFLERTLLPALGAALRPAGLLFYQTFVRQTFARQTAGQTRRQAGPENPAYWLQPGELLRAFSELHILYYCEADQAMLVARKQD